MSETNILVVDDEPEVCEMIADWLGDDAQWTVDYTTQPLRALEQVAQGRYDVMVTDLRMPEMDGLELARQARSICPGLGVVAVTGYASLASSVAALRLGFVDYIQKPFRGEEIREAVHRALDGCPEAARAATDDEPFVAGAGPGADREELIQRLELMSREMTVMQHRLAGRVADLETRCTSAEMLQCRRDVPEVTGISLMLMRESLPGDEHTLVVVGHQPARGLVRATIDQDDVVVSWAERKLARGVIRAVMKRRQAAMIEDAASSAILGDLADWITCRGAVLVVPLMAVGEVHAVGIVRREAAGEAFTAAEVRRALGRCAEIGRAIEIAMTFRQQQAEVYATLRSMVEAMEATAEPTRGHSRRVARMACRVARGLGIGDERIEPLEVAARLHDLGKLLASDAGAPGGDADADPPAPGPGDHAERGWEMLRPMAFLTDAAQLVREHHNLCGADGEMGLEVQVLAAAETYDELTHDGPHGLAVSTEDALAALQRGGSPERVVQALAGVALAVD